MANILFIAAYKVGVSQSLLASTELVNSLAQWLILPVPCNFSSQQQHWKWVRAARGE